MAIKSLLDEFELLATEAVGSEYFDDVEGEFSNLTLIDESIRDESNPVARNSSITWSIPTKPWLGPWIINYNRLHIADTVNHHNDFITLNSGESSIYEALGKFSEVLGVEMSEDDFEDGVITQETTSVILTAKPTSRFWIGSVELDLEVVGT